MPEQWPHVRALYQRAGFVHDGHVEIVLLARVERLPGHAWPEEEAALVLLGRLGFRELTRTARGWRHRSRPGSSPETDATPGPPTLGRP